MTQSISQRRCLPLRPNEAVATRCTCEHCSAPVDARGTYVEPVGTESQREFMRALSAMAHDSPVDGICVILKVSYGLTTREIAARVEKITKKHMTEGGIRRKFRTISARFPSISRELLPKTG